MAPLSHLDPRARDELLQNLNYLNMGELRQFCRANDISWKIHAERTDGSVRPTKDSDRKAIVLDRVRVYLTTGVVEGPTVYPVTVVGDGEPLPAEPTSDDVLYYGRYNKRHAELMALLRNLTGERFRNGAVARILLNRFWSQGQAPTIAEFAAAWMTDEDRGLGIAQGDHPEAAYLTDRAAGRADGDWKAKRAAIADEVLAVLADL